MSRPQNASSERPDALRDDSLLAPVRPPPFDLEVPRDGYRWWYLDAIRPETGEALVIIAFVGSVFSPYYFRARSRGRGDPEQFCAVNVALYGAAGKRWAMTERGASAVARETNLFRVGPSSLQWSGDHLRFSINERCTPLGQRLRGTVRAWPTVTSPVRYRIGSDDLHSWHCWSPQARVSVDFGPLGAWQGEGYLDSNWGREPLEAGFRHWDWSRARSRDGSLIHYDVTRRDGSREVLSLRIGPDGKHHALEPPPCRPLGRAGWGVHRTPRGAAGLKLLRGLEDTPFYTRSTLADERDGQPLVVMHESLSLDRFRQAWVRTLLPFRMPRWTGRAAPPDRRG